MKILIRLSLLFVLALLLAAWSSKEMIVNELQERDANEIIILLNSNETPDDNIGPELVNIWSIELAKHSSFRFRFLFFSLLFSNLIFIILLALFSWKLYPLLKGNSWSDILNTKQIKPMNTEDQKKNLKKKD